MIRYLYSIKKIINVLLVSSSGYTRGNVMKGTVKVNYYSLFMVIALVLLIGCNKQEQSMGSKESIVRKQGLEKEVKETEDAVVNDEEKKEKQSAEAIDINELLEKATGAKALDIIECGESEENPELVDSLTTLTNPQQIQLIVQQLQERESKLMTEGEWIDGYILRFYDRGNIMGDLTLKENILEKTFWAEYKGNQYEVDGDFFRTIKDLKRYKPNEELISEDAIALFSKYNFTPVMLVQKCEYTLPKDLKVTSVGEIETIYFGVGLEMSKVIGLDYTALLGKLVTIESYYLKESFLEGEYKQEMNPRGIVIRYQGDIVGAHLDSNDFSANYYALTGKNFEQLTGITKEEYINKKIMDTYQRPSLSDEELITAYIECNVHENYNRFYEIRASKLWLQTLFLYKEEKELFSQKENRQGMRTGYQGIKIISIEEIKDEKHSPKILKAYAVTFFIESESGGEKNFEPVYIGEENGVRVIYSQGI
ncbi:DUF4830 domain-containing protein [Cellulosilyticum sp. WCF-2]|nr:DUF4830 domain-containing protein [Cellulosilyticum sp. WCF-2]